MFIIYINDIPNILPTGGGGVQAPNFRKLYSEITVDPKVPPHEPTFWLGLEA